MHAINFANLFPNLSAPWQPIKVADCNGSEVMVAKDGGTTLV